jgi:hypothetical protein
MLLVLTAIVFALCLPAEAQQPGKIPHIGFLSLSGANQEAFRQGLRDLGYIEGKILPSNFERPPIEQIAFLSSPVSLSI